MHEDSGTSLAERDVRLAALDALTRAGNLVRHFLDETAATHGLTAPQARLVSSLAEPSRMADAGAVSGCEPSHLTAVVGQLEEAGLVRREVDPHDRRARLVRLTPKGARLRQTLLAHLEREAPIVSALDATRAKALTELLTP